MRESELARRKRMGRKVLTQAPDFSLNVEKRSAFALSRLCGSRESGIKGVPRSTERERWGRRRWDEMRRDEMRWEKKRKKPNEGLENVKCNQKRKERGGVGRVPADMHLFISCREKKHAKVNTGLTRQHLLIRVYYPYEYRFFSRLCISHARFTLIIYSFEWPLLSRVKLLTHRHSLRNRYSWYFFSA